MTARLPQPLLDVYEWQGRGACRQAAVGLFFDSDAHRGASRAAHENAAKEVCRRCPVLAQCRAHGLACEDYGIWGGLTAKERVAIRAELANAELTNTELTNTELTTTEAAHAA